MDINENRFPAQHTGKPLLRTLLLTGVILILVGLAVCFLPVSLGATVRGFSPTEKVLIANYHTTVDSHLSPQKEGELCFSYTDTEAKKAFLEILDRYVIFRSPSQVYGGMGGRRLSPDGRYYRYP